MARRWVVVFLVLLLPLALSASASAAIRIKKIAFDPPGADSGTNRHLNREWIRIKNTGNRAKQLRGWRIQDKGRDHTYRFGAIRFGPGEYLRLRTGRGDDSGTSGCNGDCFTFYDLYWGLENYVWNNDGDVATLKNRSGNVVDRCRYRASADSPKRC